MSSLSKLQDIPELPKSIPSLEDSIKEIGRLVKEPSDLDEAELPGLDVLIDDWYDVNVDVDEGDFMRRILGVFQNSIHKEAYGDVVNQLTQPQQDAVSAFVSGDATAEDAAEILLPQEASVEASVQATEETIPDNELHVEFSSMQASEPDRVNIRGHVNVEFENWGRTVKQTPAVTYYPENTAEIQTIVRDAVVNKRGVRVSGFRHSWSPLFGRENKTNNGNVLISTLTQRNAAVLPNFTSLPSSLFQPKPTELNHITEVAAAFVNGPTLKNGKKYVRVGTSTTNEQFRRWCINEGNVTLPMNIIEVEITMGGSNATICHGAGISHPTLSDLVRCIEYVDVNAEVRTLNMTDPELLRAASGCFGLLGVVTHLTFECDAMSTAVMRPLKLEVIDAIPPPPDLKDTDIPAPLRPKTARTQKEKQIAQDDFERRANHDYYAEWFWFPFSKSVWVNTWGTDPSTTNVVEYPSKIKTVYQVFGTIAMNIAQIIVEKINALQSQPLRQTTFLSWLAMKSLDERKASEKPIRTLLPNALHFQRGVQNIRVRDLEVELPIHAKKGTVSDRDYSNVQRAWWDAIRTCYANVKTCPMRMPLEMRIMGSSNVTMAPQRGHELGTCAIEILTLRAVADIWKPYAQQVLNHWTSYTDNAGGKLVVRPHWAKEWDQLEVDGRPWREKLKSESYQAEIAEFKVLLAAVGDKHQWKLSDIKRTFSNETLDFLFLDDVIDTGDARTQSHKVEEVEKLQEMLSFIRWTKTPIEGLSFDATGLIALADLSTIAKQTALSGTSGFLDPLTVCPGIHRQQHAVELNGGELPATAALTSGYVFRVENQATVFYLQKVGVSGHLVTVTVEELSNRKNGAKGTLFTSMSLMSAGNLLYATPVFMTLATLVFTIVMNDPCALAVLLTLISARTLNTIVIRRRSVSGWKGVKEPGVKGDLLVLLSQDRWIRLQGQVDALKAVTAGQWLRDMTFFESSLAAIATLLVYTNAIFTSNATQTGQIIIGLLLLLSAAILAVGNERTNSLHMHGCIVKAQGEPKKYARRLDLARELIEYTGRDDWAIRLGMINQEVGAADTIKVEL